MQTEKGEIIMKTHRKGKLWLTMCMIVFSSLYWLVVPSQTVQAKEYTQQKTDTLCLSAAEISADKKEKNTQSGNTSKDNTGAQYIYDKLNRLTKVVYADGSVVTYTYDKNGNLLNSHVTAAPTRVPTVTVTPTQTVTPTITPTITKPPTVTVTPTPVKTITPTITTPPTNQAVVYYSNDSWEKVYIHYQTGNGAWSSVPGEEMTEDTTQTGYQWKYVIDLGTASEAYVCFNDGNGNWDSNNENNYKVFGGIYGIKNKTVTKLEAPTITPVITEPPYHENQAVVYYSNDSWEKVNIHYQTGKGQWTSVPGKEMTRDESQSGYQWKYIIDLGEAKEATICFNNGLGSWDSQNGANYKVSAGTYGIKDGQVTKLSTPSITPIITQPPYQPGTVEVYYSNDNWEKVNIHYQVGNGEWTSVPGKEMTRDESQRGYQWKYVIDLGTATEATVCFNNGEGSWDSQNQSNYKVYEGCYGIKNGQVTNLTNSSGNTIEVYYANTDWIPVYIHYQVGTGEWTSLPGMAMTKTTERSGYQWKYVITLGNDSSAAVCFTDGNGNWDSKYQENYLLTEPGVYGIKDGAINKLQ